MLYAQRLLDRLNAEDGRKLLRQYRDFGADEAEWHAARQVVERLGGHALSLGGRL